MEEVCNTLVEISPRKILNINNNAEEFQNVEFIKILQEHSFRLKWEYTYMKGINRNTYMHYTHTHTYRRNSNLLGNLK